MKKEKRYSWNVITQELRDFILKRTSKIRCSRSIKNVNESQKNKSKKVDRHEIKINWNSFMNGKKNEEKRVYFFSFRFFLFLLISGIIRNIEITSVIEKFFPMNSLIIGGDAGLSSG